MYQDGEQRTASKNDQVNMSLVTYIRGMELLDLPGVLEVERHSFTVPWTDHAFHNELTNNLFARYIVIEHEGKIAGYAGMWTIVDESHVTNIAVHPDYRGKGWGAWLMRELIARALSLGMVKMTLEVRVSNTAAQQLYRKFGFEPAGVRKGYYADNNEDALIMWSDLTALYNQANEEHVK